ncbi:zinc finger protein 592 [Amphiprion ocellaris]|uniref:C2H2-type domain-containing protein n=1 Tax=Amphiprion ocellaris TaxID=80972 RepID=A0A3Q1C1A4_AMPOC|nr:zinc finger protein 592 [Amphiprion ocellaris]
MGDMKTPDFDDLLAAFDIPDATGLDAKDPIQGSHEEPESQPKHTGICLDDSLLSSQAVTTDIPAVSVIVKNTSRQESLEGFSDRLHSGSALQNGFRGQDTSTESAETANAGFSKSFVSPLNGESSRELPGKAPIQHKPDGTPVFSESLSHFSPVSSPETEDTRCSRDEKHPQERPCFPEASLLEEPPIPDNPKTMDLCVFDNCQNDSDIPKNTQRSTAESSKSEEFSDICVSDKTEKTARTHSAFPPPSSNQNFIETNCNSGTTMDVPTSYPHVKSQTSKFSSCLEALVALNSRKDPSEQIIPRDSGVQNDCMKASPKVPISPRSPRSPLEAVKRLMKPSDSPVSICSDSSGKASPAVASGSPPAIPRVRIKTIKTTTGQIKRTVTSVLPDSETDEIHSAYESSPSMSMISEDSYSNVSPHQSQTVDNIVGIQTKGNPASTPLPKVLHRKSEEHSRRSGISQSATVFHSTSGSMKRSVAHQVQKPKRASASTGHTTSTNFLPKAMHLASLNLVPHSVAASVAARSTSHQQSQHTLSSTVYSTVPLVHQVKTTNSYPRTSVSNSAAGTLNKLLNNTKPVPTYVPNLSPPPESNIDLPPQGYHCLECGDSFGVERSLTYHYSRRSVHIEVGCTHCAKTMVFFNRCAFLAHAREHKSNGMVMQCAHLHLKPISEEQMFVPLSSEPVKVRSCTSPLPSPKNEPVLPLYPDSVIRHRLRCLECNKQLPDYKALAGHYQKPSEDVEGLVCKMCSMLLPNKCSFRAHQRIHTHKSPYCCPECGALSRSKDIQKHVKENCLHYARKAWYKCLHCDVVFRTLQGQKTHIEEKHCEVFYKCSICPVAFKTSDSCEVHLKNEHGASKISPHLIFRCSCETVFKKKQLLFQHFDQDANKRVTCVFKCPECNSVFPQKQLLIQHFKSVHVGNVTAEAEQSSKETDKTDWHQDSHSVQQQKRHHPVKLTDSSRKKPEQDSRPHVKPTGWTCGKCLQWFTERESYVSHVKTSHNKSVKKYPCRHCEQSFTSAATLRRHIRSDHDGKKRIYTCWYCTDTKKTFTTSVTLKNHISLMHGIKNPDLGQIPKTSIQEIKRARGKGLVSAIPAAGTQAEGQDRAGGLEAPSAKRLKTQFRCSKCGFITDNSAQFQQHIPQHKTDENTPQCLHCGLCFTSVLSLNRHLFIVHKIKDPEEEEKQKEEEQEAHIREEKREKKWEKKQDNQQPVRSAETDEVTDLLPELNKFEPSQAEEPESPHGTKTTGCNLKRSSQTQAVSLR